MNIDEIISGLLKTKKDYSEAGFVADEKVQNAVSALKETIKSKRSSNLGDDFASFLDFDLRKLTASIEYMTSDLGCIISKPYIDCIMQLMQENIRHGRTGHLIEVGIWKGGLLILFYYLKQLYKLTDGKIIGIDTFEGLLEPAPEFRKDLEFYELMKPFGSLKIDQPTVRNIFLEHSVPDDAIDLIKCDICTPSADVEAIDGISLLRIDVDFHDPTLSALEALYPKIVEGGYVIVDDYGLPLDCRDAVDAFRLKHGIVSPIVKINHQAIYWQKS